MPPARALRGLLLDMDGVLAAIRQSYRQSTVETGRHYGVTITHPEIVEECNKGDANNDWVLTHRMLQSKGVRAPLDEVSKVYDDIYQVLCKLETLIPAKGVLQELHRRCEGRVAVVTGRPRKDCEFFLDRFDIGRFVAHTVCMEDGPLKPAPNKVLRACELLDVDPSETMMVGDTPDDVLAAVRAGSRAVGTLLPEDYADVIHNNFTSFEEIPVAKIMKGHGAECIIRPGLADLLDHYSL
eukprot:TRINITY_DN4081_c0_g1_i1.p1 TRINITY_DN4081_c0_g1~~TRINITY_DN4081_c0_g1_i1.p1  ORF type:complete len:260 (+),score=117.33 TRINITY_DN4081_c0_g1_i1:63-782(+)